MAPSTVAFKEMAGKLAIDITPDAMKQDERWNNRYNEVKAFIEERHRNPSKYVGEERNIYSFVKHCRKLMKDAPSGIYRMGDDEALSTNELIEGICGDLGKKARIWRIPRGLMNGAARLGDWLHLPMNTRRMQKLTENYVVSNAKIKATLGMKEMPVRAKDGLRETIKSFAEK